MPNGITAHGNFEQTLGAINEAIQTVKDNISNLFDEGRKQTGSMNNLKTDFEVMKSSVENRHEQYDKQFGEVNDKLGRDYKKLNDIEKEMVMGEGMKKQRNLIYQSVKYTIWVVATVLGILVAANSLLGIKQYFKSNLTGKDVQNVERSANP